MKGFIITGTDTGVGKTVVAAGLSMAMGARYWKPVQAGLDTETDSGVVRRLAPDVLVHPEAYRLNTPCSPHQAAMIDGVMIDPARLAPPVGQGLLIIEGAGGVLVPLREDLVFADQCVAWGLPVVLAARTTLGTINHTLLSLEALRARKVPVAGVVFVGDAVPESERAIGVIGGVRRLGRIPLLDPLNTTTLAHAFAEIALP